MRTWKLFVITFLFLSSICCVSGCQLDVALRKVSELTTVLNFGELLPDGNFSSLTFLFAESRQTEANDLFICYGAINQSYNLFYIRDNDTMSVPWTDSESTMIIAPSVDEDMVRILSKKSRNVFAKNSWIFTIPAYVSNSFHCVSIIERLFGNFSGIALNSRIYVANFYEKATEFYEVYKLSEDKNLTISLLCTMRNSHPFVSNCSKVSYVWERRSNLRGIKFKVGILLDGQFIYRNNLTQTMEGYTSDILKIIQHQMKFQVQFVPSVDGLTGIAHPDGKWTGIIGMLQRREIDFSIVANTMIPQRAAVVDFSTSLYVMDARLFVAKTEKSASWTTFTDVYDSFFWLVAIGVAVLLSFCLYCRSSYSHGSSVLYWGYQAGITSVLATDVSDNSIKTLQDLAKNSQYSLILERGTSSVSFFSSAHHGTNKYAAMLWSQQSRVHQQDIETVEETLLANPKSVFYGSYLPILLRFKSVPCKILASGSITKTQAGWAFQKDSAYLPIFNHQLNKIQMSGLSDRLMQKQFESKTMMCKKSAYEEIKFENILAAFAILGVGIASSALMLTFERLAKF